MVEYSPKTIEKKWQDIWQQTEQFAVCDSSEKKFYCLDMFPYPSGSGLHIGHPLGYTATDIICRYKRMHGFSVLHPMGFDAFGLPAEQHALTTGEHPAEITKKNCKVFKDQMKRLGLSYDWSREVATCHEDYYRWTQWIFLKLYNAWFDEDLQKARPIDELPIPEEVLEQGSEAIEQYRADRRLAYYADADVNWCSALGTVLANEEVIDGRSERGGFEVVRRPMKQWMLRITKYAERLINDLEEIDWPENIKEQQRNWIGRSNGVEIMFKVEHRDLYITAFTTRPDTLFGVTFFVIAPEHPAIDRLISKERREQVQKYCDEARRLNDINRTLATRKKTGVFIGSYVINPITREPIPIYVGDYVLASYGSGAVMGVPSHDERDFDFARTYQIDIRPVIMPLTNDVEVIEAVIEGELAWDGLGRMLPCEFPVARRLNLLNMANQEAGEKISGWLESKGAGRRIVNYRLRDWLFSRQRYWGEPIPIVHWEDGSVTTVAESELPIKLPEVDDYKPSETGESPLAKAEEWLWVTDQETGKRGRRETNTMPQWAGSCWYYLRFIDPHNPSRPWDPDLERKWLPVDLYVGGAEHAVLHLLYARFWHKVLYDLGKVSTNEPFKRLFNQGMVLAYAYKNKSGVLVPVDQVKEDDDGIARHVNSGEKLERIVAKMSKSLRNVVNPDNIIAQYGADTLRVYLMFMGPLDCSRVWDSKAIAGSYRFLKKAWTFCIGSSEQGCRELIDSSDEAVEIKHARQQCIGKVTDDLERLQFNTAISAMMTFLNLVNNKGVSRETVESFVLILSPFAPHLAEELWQRLGHGEGLISQKWPDCDLTILERESTMVVVQINGKKRSIVDVASKITDDDLKEVVINHMSGTSYQLSSGDRFITVRDSVAGSPKLVNVITGS